MTSHPNRSSAGSSSARNPTPEEIRAARVTAGLSRREAAELIHHSLSGWIKWEAGEARMHPGLWELFCIKAG